MPMKANIAPTATQQMTTAQNSKSGSEVAQKANRDLPTKSQKASADYLERMLITGNRVFFAAPISIKGEIMK
jgi:hypothetical protein